MISNVRPMDPPPWAPEKALDGSLQLFLARLPRYSRALPSLLSHDPGDPRDRDHDHEHVLDLDPLSFHPNPWPPVERRAEQVVR